MSVHQLQLLCFTLDLWCITACNGESLGADVVERSNSNTGNNRFTQFLVVSHQVTCHGVITVSVTFFLIFFPYCCILTWKSPKSISDSITFSNTSSDLNFPRIRSHLENIFMVSFKRDLLCAFILQAWSLYSGDNPLPPSQRECHDLRLQVWRPVGGDTYMLVGEIIWRFAQKCDKCKDDFIHRV